MHGSMLPCTSTSCSPPPSPEPRTKSSSIYGGESKYKTINFSRPFIVHISVHMRLMAVNRVTIVTRVCADYDSYLKIGPNQKERGSELSSSSSFICVQNDNSFWGFDFYSESAQMASAPGHEECLRPNDGGLFLWEGTQDERLLGDNCDLLLQATDASFGCRHLCARRDFPLRRLLQKINESIAFTHIMNSVIRVTAIGLLCWFILLL